MLVLISIRVERIDNEFDYRLSCILQETYPPCLFHASNMTARDRNYLPNSPIKLKKGIKITPLAFLK